MWKSFSGKFKAKVQTPPMCWCLLLFKQLLYRLQQAGGGNCAMFKTSSLIKEFFTFSHRTASSAILERL